LRNSERTRKTRIALGKHAYTPPEQFRGQACPGSDIYALDGVIYFVLTGRDPTPLMQVKVSEGDVHLQKFAKILAQATALELSDRYSSVEWMKTDLAPGLRRLQILSHNNWRAVVV
jgi:serine/threonine protein kinase